MTKGNKIEFALTGDTMPMLPLRGFNEPAYMGLIERLQKADVTFTNLETTVREWGEGYHELSEGTLMSTPPALLEDIKWAGIDIVSCANNHANDYGHEGLLATLRHLDEAGLPHAGSGADLEAARSPVYLETPNGKVALVSVTTMYKPWQKASLGSDLVPGRPGISTLGYEYSYTVDQEAFAALTRLDTALGFDRLRERRRQAFFSDKEIPTVTGDSIQFVGGKFTAGNNFGRTTVPNDKDLSEVCAAITEARAQADWVIFSLHSHELGGAKFIGADHETEIDAPADFVHMAARAGIDAGADIVAGHGPHFPLGIEIYQDKPIFYSFGNLIFQNESVPRFPREALARFDLPADASPDDFQEARTNGGKKGFPARAAFWESYFATCHFDGERLRHCDLFPIELGHRQPRGKRGRPRLATGEDANRILSWVAEMSHQYGTDIEISGEMGKISF